MRFLHRHASECQSPERFVNKAEFAELVGRLESYIEELREVTAQLRGVTSERTDGGYDRGQQ